MISSKHIKETDTLEHWDSVEEWGMGFGHQINDVHTTIRIMGERT